MTHTTFSHIRNSAYFSFIDRDKEPKSPEGLEGNVWKKVSIRKIRKLGETKEKIFAKADTPVVLVANNLDDLIAKNPVYVSIKES
jgi:hypothetical protein